MPTAPAEPTEPAPTIRRHRGRAWQLPARPLTAAERRGLLTADLADALAQAVSAAEWITAADAFAVRALVEAVELADPPAPAGRGITGEPLPKERVAAQDKRAALAIAIDLAADLGLTAKGRQALGVVLVPAPDLSRADEGPRRRRRPTFCS